jgi:hypothetical protein
VEEVEPLETVVEEEVEQGVIELHFQEVQNYNFH